MKPRPTIFTKIVLWFFLNLALVVLTGWIVIRVQVRWGVDSFLGGYVGRRLEPVAREIIAELESAPRTEWDSILARAGEAHGVQFYLTGMPRLFTGGTNQLPETVIRRLPAHPSRPPPRFGLPPGPEDGGSPPRSGIAGRKAGLQRRHLAKPNRRAGSEPAATGA